MMFLSPPSKTTNHMTSTCSTSATSATSTSTDPESADEVYQSTALLFDRYRRKHQNGREWSQHKNKRRTQQTPTMIKIIKSKLNKSPRATQPTPVSGTITSATRRSSCIRNDNLRNKKVKKAATSSASIYKPKRLSSVIYKRLSAVSRMYDVDRDGQLDDAELAMRGMDKSNRGYLTNREVYALMREKLETQKQLFKVKRIMFVFLAFVFVLGTSFAAASLAKDTTTSSTAALMDKKTNEAVSTQTTSDSLTIERAVITPDGRLADANFVM